MCVWSSLKRAHARALHMCKVHSSVYGKCLHIREECVIHDRDDTYMSERALRALCECRWPFKYELPNVHARRAWRKSTNNKIAARATVIICMAWGAYVCWCLYGWMCNIFHVWLGNTRARDVMDGWVCACVQWLENTWHRTYITFRINSKDSFYTLSFW